MRKLATLTAALVLCCTSLFGQITPYEYGKRWNIYLQGGAVYFNSDYSDIFSKRGKLLTPTTLNGALAVGYNISDGHEVRVMASYGRRISICPNYQDNFTVYDKDGNAPLYTYSFGAAQLFVDHVLNYNGLAEYNIPLAPKTYGGVGAACSFDFTDPGQPEVWLYPVNIVPAFHFGMILEYDFPFGLGVYTDVGLAFFFDRYNGMDVINFPLDMEVGVQFGLVYHFPRAKKR